MTDLNAKLIPLYTEVLGRIPTASQVEAGELAVNLADRIIYSKKSDGTIVTLGNANISLSTLIDVNTTSPAPTDGQLLKWTASTSKWTPASPRPHVLRRAATSVSGTVTVDSSRDYQTLVWTGALPKALLAAGTEGAQVELFNRSTVGLQLQASLTTLNTPSGWL